MIRSLFRVEFESLHRAAIASEMAGDSYQLSPRFSEVVCSLIPVRRQRSSSQDPVCEPDSLHRVGITIGPPILDAVVWAESLRDATKVSGTYHKDPKSEPDKNERIRGEILSSTFPLDP